MGFINHLITGGAHLVPWYISKNNKKITKNCIQSAKMRINQRIKNGDSFAVETKYCA